MEKIIKLLKEGNYSCVVEKGEIRTFTKRGVTDLFHLLQKEPDFLSGAAVADKVVGKAAASLLVKGKVKQVYADVISDEGWNLLKKYGTDVNFGKKVKTIMNRAGTDLCPMEKLCGPAQSPEECFTLIGNFIHTQKTKQELKID